MEPRTSARPSALKAASTMKPAMIEVCTGVIKGVAIGEDSAVGNVAVVVEGDAVVMPVISPVVPAPAKAAEEANTKAETKRNSRSGKVQPWIPIPARPNSEGLSIHEPGIVFRHVNDLRISRLDYDRLPLLGHVLL